jgi:hypothetical protein
VLLHLAHLPQIAAIGGDFVGFHLLLLGLCPHLALVAATITAIKDSKAAVAPQERAHEGN